MEEKVNNGGLTHLEFLDSLPLTSFHWLLIFTVALAQALDGLDFMSTSFALPGIIQEFKVSQAAAGLASSITNFGLLIGAVVFAAISDKWGRKWVFQVVLATYAFGSFLSAIAPTYGFFLVSRFIAGLGIGAEFPVAFALLAEYAPVRYRSKIVPLGPMFYNVGWIVAALLSLVLIIPYGWRSIYWVGILPAVVILLVRQFVPESVRFLLLRGRVDEATAIVTRIGRLAGREFVPPSDEPVIRQTEEKRERRTPYRLVLAPLIALSLLYFCFFLQTFGMTAWLPTIFFNAGYTLFKSFSFTLFIYLVSPFSQLAGSYLQDRLPRRWALAALAVVGSFFFILFGLSFQFKWSVTAAVFSNVLATFFIQGVIAILYTLGTEVFPTYVRSSSLGIVTAIGRVGAIVGPLLLGVLLTARMPVPTIVYIYAGPLVVAAVIALVLLRADTRMKRLEDITAAAGS